MANLDVEYGFIFSRFNWETIEGYGRIMVKYVGDNMYSSLCYFRCEPFLGGRCLIGSIFLLSKESISTYAAELIVNGSMSTVPVFRMNSIYLIVTVHNIFF